MTFNKSLFQSMYLDWTTPETIYSSLNEEFHFDFDPCPHDPQFNGLEVEWGQRNFVNPPYGRVIKAWCQKAYSEFQKGKIIVMLVASRTDTAWWHDYIMKATEIRFIRGRLKFGGHGGNSAPFPSAIVIFNPIICENCGKQIPDNFLQFERRVTCSVEKQIVLIDAAMATMYQAMQEGDELIKKAALKNVPR